MIDHRLELPATRGDARLPNTREGMIAGILFAVWCAHLLAYVWLVPPWQHYDEPTHFEYAALIRDLGRLPTLDEQIPSLRRAIATSMVESGFFDNPALSISAPDLDDPNLSLGINERGHPPLYYALVALGTLPFQDAPVLTQLYAARCVSVLIALLLFWAAYLTLRLLTGADWRARILALAALALQPAFVDNMSSVNNDALANLVGVLLLLAGAVFLRRPGWPALLLGVGLIVLAWNVKRTLLIYSLVVPAAWLLALTPRARRWLLAGATIGAAALLIGLLLQPWALADWRATPASAMPEARSTEARHGAAAFMLATRPGQAQARLSQSIYSIRLPDIAGKTVTLAAWMRADRAGLPASAPVIEIDGQAMAPGVTLDADWRLVTTTVTLPDELRELSVHLDGPTLPGTVLYDSLALVVGGADQLPAAGAPDGSFEPGLLGPDEPRNLLRNAGAERRVPYIANLERIPSGGLLNGEGARQALSSLFHPAWIAAVYPRQALVLFQGAWGVFGWGHTGVSIGWFTPLAILVALSIAGMAIYSWRELRPGMADKTGWQRHAWWLCVFAVTLGWGAALVRVHSQPFPGAMFWSFGRYTFVAIVPSLLAFVVGLRAILPASLRAQGLAGAVAFLALFALAALSGFLF